VEANNYIIEINGSMVGMAAQLHNGEADIAIAVSYILKYGVEHFTALIPLCKFE